MKDQPKNWARSHQLIFCYNESMEATMQELMDKYDVTFEVISLRPVDASGFPTVAVCGVAHKVVKCIAECWDDGGSTIDEMYDFANMMIDMPGAGFRWNSDHDSFVRASEYFEHLMDHYLPGVDYEENPNRPTI